MTPSAQGSSPIFIVGANRSGTTLLRLMLNAHSRIAIPEELLYLRSHYAGVPVEQWKTPDLDPDTYASIVRDFVNNVVELHPELNGPEVTAQILDEGPQDLRRPYQVVLETWATHHGAVRWGEKTPGNLFYVDILHDMFPDAYFIYVVRDPRAGVASMLKTDFFPDDVIFNAMNREKHARVGSQLLRDVVAPNHRCAIRYEDLAMNPEECLRGICELIAENYEPGMLQYHQSADSFMKTEAADSFNASATQPVTTSRIDAWRDELSNRDIAVIEAICGDEMREHGYTPVGIPLAGRDSVERLIKGAYWRLQEVRNRRVRHYTVRHPLFARSRERIRSAWTALRKTHKRILYTLGL